jgi:hypothetical protein
MQTRPLQDLVSDGRIHVVADELRELLEKCDAYVVEAKQCEPTDNPAVYIDFKDPEYWARITAWESGHCDSEILRISDGHQVSWLHQQVTSEDEYVAAVKSTLSKMRIDSSLRQEP